MEKMPTAHEGSADGDLFDSKIVERRGNRSRRRGLPWAAVRVAPAGAIKDCMGPKAKAIAGPAAGRAPTME